MIKTYQKIFCEERNLNHKLKKQKRVKRRRLDPTTSVQRDKAGIRAEVTEAIRWIRPTIQRTKNHNNQIMWQSPITLPLSQPHNNPTKIPNFPSHILQSLTQTPPNGHRRRNLLLPRYTPRRNSPQFWQSPSPVRLWKEKKSAEEIAVV